MDEVHNGANEVENSLMYDTPLEEGDEMVQDHYTWAKKQTTEIIRKFTRSALKQNGSTSTEKITKQTKKFEKFRDDDSL
jgi:hypothetical protein